MLSKICGTAGFAQPHCSEGWRVHKAGLALQATRDNRPERPSTQVPPRCIAGPIRTSPQSVRWKAWTAPADCGDTVSTIGDDPSCDN